MRDVDGISRVHLTRDICKALFNERPHSLSACLELLESGCRATRLVIIVDEADKCPVPYLELIRGINERCHVPFVLVGEEALRTKLDRVPRLRSRVRKPAVVFEPIKDVDVAAYYKSACGIDINRDIAAQLTRRAKGGFRTVANDSIALSKLARASGIATVTQAMVDELM